MASAALLLLAACLALPAAAQPQYLLKLTLTAERVGDKAVGTATIVNPTNKPVQVGKLYFDITHYDTNMVQRDDIRQQFTMKACGSTTFPTKLAAGAVLKCPFTSSANTYHGPTAIVAGAMKLTEENYSGNYLGFDVIPKLMPLAADGKAAVFTELKQTNIPGKDIACGQKDWQGKPAVFCKICGGKAAVQMACMAKSNCVAFDLEGADQYCGYLKSAKGPFKSPAQGFSSFVKA